VHENGLVDADFRRGDDARQARRDGQLAGHHGRVFRPRQVRPDQRLPEGQGFLVGGDVRDEGRLAAVAAVRGDLGPILHVDGVRVVRRKRGGDRGRAGRRRPDVAEAAVLRVARSGIRLERPLHRVDAVDADRERQAADEDRARVRRRRVVQVEVLRDAIADPVVGRVLHASRAEHDPLLVPVVEPLLLESGVDDVAVRARERDT
jgi:hypothetical protein